MQRRERLADVKNAEHAIDVALKHDELVVIARLKLMQDLLEGRVEVERLDAPARNHHVVDGDVLQIEQIEQDAAVLGRHEAAGFQHDGAQFFGRNPLIALVFRVDVQRGERRVGEQIDEPDERPRDAHERREHEARRQRDFLGIGCADDFRRDLCEHDDQKRDDTGRDRQDEIVMAERAQRDRCREHRNDRVDQVVADQDDGEKLIGLREQALRRAGA
ncbi:hypothetical protein AWB82_06859 [Caballeronia glebae]|uniref:Uncharacterized protein n=1 Tax=Caballeronia glebae TaxID=1777143 RepID=A0A158DMM6_9BURK|nr:hypothetical protein AWB82_06859 [Caballeronia glebae]